MYQEIHKESKDRFFTLLPLLTLEYSSSISMYFLQVFANDSCRLLLRRVYGVSLVAYMHETHQNYFFQGNSQIFFLFFTCFPFAISIKWLGKIYKKKLQLRIEGRQMASIFRILLKVSFLFLP